MAGAISRSDVMLRFLGEDKTSKALKQIDRNLSKTGKTTDTLNAAFNKMKGTLAGLGLLALGKKALDSADNIQKLSIRLGASTEALSELKFVGEQSGVEFGNLSTGLQRMTRRISEAAATGKGEAVPALKELGLAANRLNELPLDKQFEVIAEKMSGMTSESDRVRVAMKLFDTEGVALVQTMTNGAAGIQEMRAEAKALGLTLSQDQANAAAAAKDAMNRFNKALESIVTTLVTAFAPILEKVANFMATRLVPAIDGVKVVAIGMALGVLKAFRSVEQAIKNLTGGSVKSAKTALDEVNTTLKVQAETTGTTVEALLAMSPILRDKLAGAQKVYADAVAESNGEVSELDKLIGDLEQSLGANVSKIIKTSNEMRNLGAVTQETVEANRALVGSVEEIPARYADWRAEIEETANELLATKDVLTEIEVTGMKTADVLANSFEEAANRIANAFQFVANNVGGELGQLANTGASAAGNFASGNYVQAAIDAIDFVSQVFDLFDSNPPRIDVVNNLNNNRDPSAIQSRSPFTDQFGNSIFVNGRRVTEELGREEGQAIVNALTGLDEAIFGLLNDEQRFNVGQALVPGGNTETSSLYRGDFTPEEILLDRFDTILGGIGGAVEALVRGTGFNDLEQGIEALTAVQSLMGSLALTAQDFVDAGAGPDSLLGVMEMQAIGVRQLTESFDGSLGSIQRLDSGLIGLGQTLSQVIAQAAQAQRQIEVSTASTIFGLRFNALGNDQDRLGFLDAEIERLFQSISGLGSSSEVTSVLSQIQALTQQSQGIAATLFGDDQAGFQAFTEAQVAATERAAEEAAARNQEIVDQATRLYDEQAEASRAAIAEAGVQAGQAIAEQLANPIGEFGGYVGAFAGAVQNIQVSFDISSIPEEISSVG